MTSLGYVTKVSKPLMANLIARVLTSCKHIEFSGKAGVAQSEDAYGSDGSACPISRVWVSTQKMFLFTVADRPFWIFGNI